MKISGLDSNNQEFGFLWPMKISGLDSNNQEFGFIYGQ